MSTHLLLLTAALTIGAAEPAQTPTPPPKASPVTLDDRLSPPVPTFVVVDGCVAAEAEIPGRTPNIAERAGVAEDYILTNATVLKGKPPVELPDRTGGEASNALRPMYELGGLTGDQLKPHLGHRVRIEGTFVNTNRDPGTEPLNDDLVELTGASIRQVPGSCPQKKS
jgi:hypothetical protein